MTHQEKIRELVYRGAFAILKIEIPKGFLIIHGEIHPEMIRQLNDNIEKMKKGEIDVIAIPVTDYYDAKWIPLEDSMKIEARVGYEAILKLIATFVRESWNQEERGNCWRALGMRANAELKILTSGI